MCNVSCGPAWVRIFDGKATLSHIASIQDNDPEGMIAVSAVYRELSLPPEVQEAPFTAHIAPDGTVMRIELTGECTGWQAHVQDQEFARELCACIREALPPEHAGLEPEVMLFRPHGRLVHR